MTEVRVCVRCKELRSVVDFPRTRLLKSGVRLYGHVCHECDPPREHKPKVQRAPKPASLDAAFAQMVRTGDGRTDD